MVLSLKNTNAPIKYNLEQRQNCLASIQDDSDKFALGNSLLVIYFALIGYFTKVIKALSNINQILKQLWEMSLPILLKTDIK